MAFGLGIDYLLPREWFVLPLQQLHTCCDVSVSYFHIGCTLLLAALLANALLHRYLPSSTSTGSCSCGHCPTDQLVVQVEGMSCNHCKANVEKALRQLEGVTDVEVDLQTGRCVLHGQTTAAEARQAVEAIGFTVR